MRNFGNDHNPYDREFGPRRDWGSSNNFRGGMGMAGWQGTGAGMRQGTGGQMNYDRNYGRPTDRNPRYDQTFRGQDRGARGYDHTFGMSGYDRGYRDASTSRGHEPFPTRSSVSSNPMNAERPGYDRGFFGMSYDSDMKRYDRNFGDFRNSYFSTWF